MSDQKRNNIQNINQPSKKNAQQIKIRECFSSLFYRIIFASVPYLRIHSVRFESVGRGEKLIAKQNKQ